EGQVTVAGQCPDQERGFAFGGGVNAVSNCVWWTPSTKICSATLPTANEFGQVARFSPPRWFVSWFALTTCMKCPTVFAAVQSPVPAQGGSGPGLVATM